MNIRITSMQGYCEKKTGSLRKACDLSVIIQPEFTLPYTHSCSHISFLSQVLRGSQLVGVPLLLARSWRFGNKKKNKDYVTFHLQLGGKGRGVWWKTRLQALRMGLRRRECRPWPALYQLTRSYISHIATFSAKQKSPRCKWHRSRLWRWRR